MINGQNQKLIFDKYYVLLFLLLTVLIFFNFSWIKNDERPISCEDEILLGSSTDLYLKNLYGLEFYKELLDLNYPPFIPFLIQISFKIFGPSFDSALYVNLIFWPVLVLSCFFLGKKFYNKKTGLLAAFILSTLPPIIIYGLSFGICLLARYTSLPYIIVPPVLFILFKPNPIKNFCSTKQLFKTLFRINMKNNITIITKIILSLLFIYFAFFSKFYLRNTFLIILLLLLVLLIILTKKSIINNFIDSMILAFVTAIIWYANKFFSLISMYLPQFVQFTSNNPLSITSNIFFYLIFLINYQLGFLNFVILILVGIFFSVRYYKQRRIDEQDLLLFLIFLIPYIFYIFVPAKNLLVTTSLLIPISFIMAKGIFESPKIIKAIFLVVVIFGGLFYLLPFQSFNRTISFDLGTPLWLQITFAPKNIIKTKVIDIFSKKDDLSRDFSKNSKFYTLKDQQQIKDISKVIYAILSTKNRRDTSIFFLYYDNYIYSNVLNYYLSLMNISSSSFDYNNHKFYDKMNIPINFSHSKNQEKVFEWIYNFDFVIVPAHHKKIDIPFRSFNKNYYVIHSYILNSEEFKKNFKLVYKSNISDQKAVGLYENKFLN